MKAAAIALTFSSSFAAATLRAQSAAIQDPVVFVTDVYKHYVSAQDGGDYRAPTNIYTPRLSALFADDDRKHKGEVGCIDFDFWVNGQDWEIENVQVTGRDVSAHPDQKLVIAKFVNLGTAEEIHFDFRKIAGGWLLDDVQSVTPKNSWTLSKLLRCKS